MPGCAGCIATESDEAPNPKPIPVRTVRTVPLGQIVIVGQGVWWCRRPQDSRWLTLTVTVARGFASVSVPEPGDTLTALPGSLAMLTDQLTVPPKARR